ncbi:hypothetical protein O181_103941 [Austropuccinia psidii MF-1]|uniref:Uncharacterized protein n=1 Tax=Austropuccinia psidii MF-1 TaxID=1389203 RepID=A0A9Q3JLB5_9BASI|nr:hypothetical protein [Austropuccinia psidii MF-1]
MKDLSHQDNNQVLIKEAAQLKEWPTFTGEEDDHNDKEEESDSEKDTEESKTSESDEINIINAPINHIDLIYEALDVSSNLPQVGISDTNLTNIQDAKLYRTKPAKGMGYTAGKSSISIFMVENQEAKGNLDTGAHFTCFGKGYLKLIVTDWERKLIPIKGVRFSSASESMKTLGIIDLTLIFPHPSQFIRVKICQIKKTDILPWETIRGNRWVFKSKKQITVIKKEEKNPEKDFFIRDQLKEAELNQELTEKTKEKLLDLSIKYEDAFATDKEPSGAIIGHQVDIILKVEKPYPPLLRRPAYPASPRAREALEIHIKQLTDLGVLRKVGHNEKVEVTTPVIITWNNGKSRMVGDFRALNIYNIPDRYPIPRILETLTQLS